MKKQFLATLVIGVSTLSISMPVMADERDARIQALEKNMMLMMQEIQTLKAERAADKQQIRELKESTQASIAAIQPAAGEASDSDLKITMSPTPKIQKGDFSWQPTGRIHLDAGGFNDDAADHPNGAEFRRVRLGMKGQLTKDIGYKTEFDFANEGVAIKDAYLNYTGIEDTELRLGNHKPPMGLEEMTSSNDLTFLERSSITGALGTGEIIGASARTHGESWSFGTGVFNDDPGRQSTDDEAWSVGARVTGAPVNDDGKVLHLGASATHREPDQANDTFDIDSRAENSLQTMDSVSAVLTDSEDMQIYGLEAAGVLGPVSAQGEYFFADINNRAGNDPTFQGGYAQLSWFPTGESRQYKGSTGTFGRPTPLKPFDPANDDWGALEFAARYSHIDLNEGGITGGEMDNVTLGANWYLNKYVRFMGNAIFVDTDDNAVTPDDDPQVYIFRAQGSF